ncbi:MAG: Transglycosylase SLT domain protein [Microgenomates bacterium OLB22]|nr:MAG: Transglycosylase SLT domain protein [Microgenomates bacterium OLB22]
MSKESAIFQLEKQLREGRGSTVEEQLRRSVEAEFDITPRLSERIPITDFSTSSTPFAPTESLFALERSGSTVRAQKGTIFKRLALAAGVGAALFIGSGYTGDTNADDGATKERIVLEPRVIGDGEPYVYTNDGPEEVKIGPTPTVEFLEREDSPTRIDIPWLPRNIAFWNALIEERYSFYGIDPDLGALIQLMESGGSPDAESGQASGLMQIAPGTARGFIPQLGMSRTDLSDPEVSATLGAWHSYTDLQHAGISDGSDNNSPDKDTHWKRTVGLAGASYNGGKGAVDYYKRNGRFPDNTQTGIYREFLETVWPLRHDASVTYPRIEVIYNEISLKYGVNAALSYLQKKAVKQLDERYPNWRTESYTPLYSTCDMISNPAILALGKCK